MAGGTASSGAGIGDEFNKQDYQFDRRRARSRRTRKVIVEATIDLIDAGNPRPTTRQVADQAKVSVRSLFNHFEGMEDLFCTTAEVQVERHQAMVAFVPSHGPVEARIRVACRQRRQLYEVVGPILQVAYAASPRSERLTVVVAMQRQRLRHCLIEILRPEIASRGPMASVLVETLELATGWPNWSSLRFGSGHTASNAEQIMIFAVTRLLQ